MSKKMGKSRGTNWSDYKMKERQQTKQKVLIAAGVTVVVALLIVLALSGGNLELLRGVFKQDFSTEELSDRLRDFGWRGYIVMAALTALQVLCTVLPAGPVQVLSGFAFGFPVGLACCAAGALLGYALIFMLEKLFGDRVRAFFFRKLNLDTGKIAGSGKVVLILLALYLLPVIPYGAIGFLAAGTGMSYRRFLVVTGLGTLPTMCVGVGLGCMVVVSDWTVTVCVFAVLILLAVVLFCKRNLLLSRLDGFAAKSKKSSKNKVQPVNAFVMNTLYFGIRLYLFLCGIHIKTVNRVGTPKSPAIVLCNHGSFVDFIYAAALLRKFKPHFIVARLYFYNTILGFLLRKVGSFPKSMFAVDMENAKNCLTVLKNGEILAMMPEARLSTAGRFEDIQESTCSFLKKAGVDVYTVKINGDYLADPKWGKGFRRGSVVEVELDVLYTAEQICALSPEEMKQGVEQRLSYDEFDWLAQRPNIRYRSPRMAEGLENILSVCPVCGGKYTITTQKDKVCCDCCGYLTSVNDRYGFDEGFRFEHLGQWYDWQKAGLEQEIARREDYVLTSKVELRLPGSGRGLTRHGGMGVCTLNREGLTYSGTKDGEEVELRFPLRRIYRLLFGAGENFEIYDGAEILYFVPEERRSAVEWYMTSMILHDGSVEASQ